MPNTTGDTPWLPIWLGQLRALTTLSRRLQLAVASREPVKEPREHEHGNAYSRLALEHQRERN